MWNSTMEPHFCVSLKSKPNELNCLIWIEQDKLMDLDKSLNHIQNFKTRKA